MVCGSARSRSRSSASAMSAAGFHVIYTRSPRCLHADAACWLVRRVPALTEVGWMADDKMEKEPASGVRPGVMFRWGLYVSLGVLAVLAAAAAVYTTRAVLVRVLIALFIAVSLDPAVRALTRRG